MTKAQKLFSYIHTIIIYHLQHGRKKIVFFDHKLFMSGSNARQFRKEKKRCNSESWYTIIICDYGYNHHWRLSRDEDWLWLLIQTAFDLRQSAIVYVQGNFRDTPVSKYDSQSQTLTHPFKTLLSQSFTLEPYTGLWVLSTFSSPAICHFNSITKPTLFGSLSPTMRNSWECEQLSLCASKDMCVCTFYLSYSL